MLYAIAVFSNLLARLVIPSVALKRGRRRWPWAILTFLIGWFSLIPLFLLPNLSERAAEV